MAMEKKTRVFKLPLELWPWQQEVDNCKARFVVIEGGRRAGKTRYAVYKSCLWASKPNTVNWYVGKTFNQVKETAWHMFLQMLPSQVVKYTNKTEMSIHLTNGSAIYLKGSDQEANLRGRGIHSVVIEEAAFHGPTIWPEVIRPSLADTQGSALFISSTQGINWFHKAYLYAKESKDPEWAAFHVTIFDNPNIPASEIASIRAANTDMVWREEYMAEVFSHVGLVYPECTEANFVHPNERFHEHKLWSCVRSIDWGSGEDETACTWLHIKPDSGEVFTAQEYIQGEWDVPRQANVISQKSIGRQIRPGCSVLDMSAFRKEITSGSSIADQFHQHGITCVRAIKDIDVSIDICKRYLRGLNGNPWVFISYECKRLRDAMMSWEWGQHEPDVLAAWRYGLSAIHLRNMTWIHGNENLQLEQINPVVARDGTRHLQRHEPSAMQWEMAPDFE